ncbi:Hypothetical predicted protein [Mytilus galloprovincialis]|uniref:Uncharacterized protein n=1 Tax=Mytilus galloprovincialis TaxID=29158 RepID=A0A8B6D890_MYTGA|nr:Hypothetical predicted protein [Mytilus galloprovincialis]
MVKNLDSTTFVKKLYTGEDRRNLMVLKIDSICNWEQFLMHAPTSIAILGQLMAIATKKDFSLDKPIQKGGFKFVKYPDSFRACLVQISSSGCNAFMEAHKSMVKIHMYTMQFQETIRYVVNILTKGSEEEKIKILPGMFDELKNDADKCIHLLETTENKFNHVMLLIDETSESSAAVKGVYEDGIKEAVKKIKDLEKEEIFITNQKSQSKSDNAKYNVELRKTELDDSSQARIKYLDEVRKMDKEQTSVLEKLSKTKIERNNFKEIQKTLKESLIILSQLREQWNRLVLFCQNITIEIDVCLSQKTYILYRRLMDGGYSVGHSTRDVLEMAASVNCVAYSVELIATAFADVSKQHLIPNTASLVALIAYDPAEEGEQLDRRRRQIDDDCKKAKAEILALAEKSRKDMERKIDDIYERLEEQLNKLPPLPQAKVQEIKENVGKSSMSEMIISSCLNPLFL